MEFDKNSFFEVFPMGLFSDVLLCVDYDRTLTAPDSTIPKRNLEAISYFMENGGAFTVNTGRSLPMAGLFLDKVPINAPVLLYNGAAAYDTETKTFPILHPIPMDQAETLRKILSLLSPGMVLEIQSLDKHYAMVPSAQWDMLYHALGCENAHAAPESDFGPFLKASICGPFGGMTIESLFHSDPALVRQYDALETSLKKVFGSSLSILRASPQILDIQSGSVNKGTAARELAVRMGRKILVCVGDERNDIAMLDMADYAYCPSDGKMADRYENVCPCAEGAVADVIYKKIPLILGKQP